MKKTLGRIALLALAAGCMYSCKEDKITEGGSVENTPQQLTSLPTVYIDTENGAPIESKENYINADVRMVADGETELSSSARIRGRGNSTWRLDKKPYRISFDSKQAFAGEDNAKAKKWVMLANHADKTMLRNSTAFFIAGQLGQPFVPSSRFVDLVLNDKYVGTYEISDFLEIKKDRINAGDTGFFVEADGSYGNEKESSCFFSGKGIPFTIKDPDADDMWPQQIQYIKDCIQHFEDVLFSDSWLDPVNGYRALVDSTSLVSWFLTCEFTANIDSYWSANVYSMGDGRMYFGPVWDFDIAFNNCNRMGDVSEKMMMAAGFGRNLIGIWVKRMWSDPWFRQLAVRTWHEAHDGGIVNAVTAHIDRMAAEISQSQQLNYQQWSINTRYYNEMYLFDTYQEGVSFLKEFIGKRASYLDRAFEKALTDPDAPDFNTNPFKPQNWYYNFMDEVNQWLLESDNGELFIRRRDPQKSDIECWRIVPNSAGTAFMFVDRANGLAITDVSEQDGSSFVSGTRVALQQADESDARQWWQILDYYAFWTIRNCHTGLIVKHASTETQEVVTDADTPENRALNNFKWHIMLAEPIGE